MANGSRIPEEDLRRVAAAQCRFLGAVSGLADEDVRRPSALPGWTIAHVLTHVARNADSHRRRAEAAVRGEVVDQYPGGYEGRAAEIEAGAVRGVNELIEDVRASADLMDAAWRRVPEAAWVHVTRDVAGTERPLSVLPSRRWQELEVHLIDLGIGPTHRDWSEDFVAAWLPALRKTLRARLPEGAQPPGRNVLDGREELAWLYGRFHRADLPELRPWG